MSRQTMPLGEEQRNSGQLGFFREKSARWPPYQTSFEIALEARDLSNTHSLFLCTIFDFLLS